MKLFCCHFQSWRQDDLSFRISKSNNIININEEVLLTIIELFELLWVVLAVACQFLGNLGELGSDLIWSRQRNMEDLLDDVT